MADKAHKKTDKMLAEMEAHLSVIYAQAEKEIEEQAAAYFEKLKKLDEQKKKQVAAGKITEEEYKEWLRNKIMYGEHWTQMKEQIAEQYADLNRTALAYINGRLPEVYSINYNFSAKKIENAINNAISYDLINPNIVKNFADKHRTFLPFKTVNGRKYQRWCAHKINAEILLGIMQGENINSMASRLQNVSNMDKAAAIRNARTMVTCAENKARQDTAEKAEEKGVIMKKAWLYVHDHRVRDSHKEAGIKYSRGNAIDLKKPFLVGGESLMYPGDPSGSPENVYNCRCTRIDIPVGFKSILPPEKRGKIKVTFV